MILFREYKKNNRTHNTVIVIKIEKVMHQLDRLTKRCQGSELIELEISESC